MTKTTLQITHTSSWVKGSVAIGVLLLVATLLTFGPMSAFSTSKDTSTSPSLPSACHLDRSTAPCTASSVHIGTAATLERPITTNVVTTTRPVIAVTKAQSVSVEGISVTRTDSAPHVNPGETEIGNAIQVSR